MKRVVVIGAGPAGMMAAGIAALGGARVTLVEKKDRVGRKLSITGNSRCNLTTSVNPRDLIKGFPGNGRFLYSAFSEFSNYDLIEFFNQLGLETKVEPGNRVFPASGKAEEVVGVLFEYVRNAGVDISISTPVKHIWIEDKAVKGISLEDGIQPAEAIVVATGGMSYPGTGSTGDGYFWARQAGHRIVDPRPGLIPLLVTEEWVKELQGLSLKAVKAAAYTAEGRLLSQDCGELLFTHYGLSGPVILSMSHAIGDYLHREHRPATLKLDLKPGLNEEILDQQMQREWAGNSRRKLKNALSNWLPPKMIPVVINLSTIDAEKECHQITRTERQGLGKLFKALPLTVHGTRPLAEAMVTAGGVDVKEVNPKTMESKLVKGLFFAGEVLDIDGYTGGYNLQSAFSTGYVAGRYAAMTVHDE